MTSLVLKSTPQSYSLHLLSLSSLALSLSTLLAISTLDIETPHFHRYTRCFPSMHGACILLFIVRTRNTRTYHRACILLFTVHTRDARTYHGHRILLFTVCTHDVHTYHEHRVRIKASLLLVNLFAMQIAVVPIFLYLMLKHFILLLIYQYSLCIFVCIVFV